MKLNSPAKRKKSCKIFDFFSAKECCQVGNSATSKQGGVLD